LVLELPSLSVLPLGPTVLSLSAGEVVIIYGSAERLLVEFSSCTPGLCGLTVSGRFGSYGDDGSAVGCGRRWGVESLTSASSHAAHAFSH